MALALTIVHEYNDTALLVVIAAAFVAVVANLIEGRKK